MVDSKEDKNFDPKKWNKENGDLAKKAYERWKKENLETGMVEGTSSENDNESSKKK